MLPEKTKQCHHHGTRQHGFAKAAGQLSEKQGAISNIQHKGEKQTHKNSKILAVCILLRQALSLAFKQSAESHFVICKQHHSCSIPTFAAP